MIYVGHVFVVGDNGDWMGRSLDILPPFREGKDDHEEFAIIYIVVPFNGEEGAREVSAWVEIAIGISLE